MATVSQPLTLAEFEAKYAHEKPYYEFWFGEAVQKSMATLIHGLLQVIIASLLRGAGYKAASELELRIVPDFHPVPDVVASKSPMEHPYPTKAVDVVVEILSEDDSMSRLLAKCRAYQRWGLLEIYVVDPDSRTIFRWFEHRLEEIDTLAGQNVSKIWLELDNELAP